MSNKKAKKENNSGTSFDNLKTLSAALGSGASISELINDIKSLRKRVETAILAQQAAQQKKVVEVQKIEEQKPPAPPTVEKKTAQINIEESKKVVESKESESKHQKVVDSQKPNPKPIKQENVQEKKSFTPSYIRGEVVPPPAPPAPTKDRKPKKSVPKQPPQAKGEKQDNKRNAPSKQPIKIPVMAPPPIPVQNKKVEKKKEYNKGEIKKPLSKRTLIRKGFITENDEERMGSRKLKTKKPKAPTFVAPKIEKAVITTENLTVKMLSEKIGRTAQEIIKQLMILGIVTNINSVVDFPTMELVANELGVQLELKLEQTKESLLEEQHGDESDRPEDLVKRPPIVTVMGHVDHGKTTLLDAIRKTNVATGEAGGITQHIGAYSVKCKGEKITFLDTPGHEAFTELRKRGANVTDIAVLIVAADDGVMPQTVEAINHAKAANVPILVAINKVDKPAADIDRIKQELTTYDLIPEEWGGETIMVPISAKFGQGIDTLLEMILLLAEVHEFKANPNRSARAYVIESKLDKGKGPVANVIVKNGTLKVGDFVVSGLTYGKVRAMIDENGKRIKEASPSTPVSILGLDEVPEAGDMVYVVSDEKMAKQVIDERKTKIKNEQANKVNKVSLDDLISKHEKEQLKEFSIIIKGDVQGSVEALKISLAKLENEEIRVNIPHSGVGAINKSDVMLAEVSKAVIIGFNVKPDADAKTLAEKSGIEIKLYDIIYEAIDDVERMIKGMREPKYRLVTLGRAQVRNVFKLSSVGMVAGSYVLDGKIQRGAMAKVYRDGKVIHEGHISGLKRFKDDVKEVATGYECGITVSGYDDIKENDEIEAIIQEEIKN